MKKTAKKLVLAKETLRRMEGAELAEVAGGSVYACPPPTWYNSCGRICLDEPIGP
jgi:hypothetical protein